MIARPISFALALVLLALATRTGTADDSTVLSFAEASALWRSACYDCHAGDAPEGGVQLGTFPDERAVLLDKKLWRRVAVQLKTGAMPPEEAEPLSDETRARLLAWTEQMLARPIEIAPEERHPGRSVIRRLTRTEYKHTLRDLLGVEKDIAAAVGMPSEETGHGFDNLAEALRMQGVFMEKYFAAADEALDQFFTPSPDDAGREARRREAHERVFFVRPDTQRSQRQAAREVMQRFLRRAYRRPVEGIEVERYLKLYDAAGGSRKGFEEAVRVMLKAALVSPNFLLRIEENRAEPGSSAPYRISDFELASRLSYFLWASMPDDRLFDLAAADRLSDPEVLDAEVTRMLADPKAQALAEHFAGQWLQLRKLPAARPSTEFFPTLTPALRDAMREETVLFFDSIRTENRSLVTLLDADYTFVNQALAEHYGMSGVSGPEFRRVALAADDVRGGVLSMASILTINAHTFRTSPTMRGTWILEVIFGTPPPPPPANASQLKEEDANASEPKDFREVLARHAKDAACQTCHKRIDPLGFGLENFDAIGRYRETHGGEPIDASGILPGGERFHGPRELKKVILARRDDFLRHAIERMYSYALGREIEYHDQADLESLFLDLERDDHRLGTLVRGIARSYAFQHRQNVTAGERTR
jgi:hypothetical protein